MTSSLFGKVLQPSAPLHTSTSTLFGSPKPSDRLAHGNQQTINQIHSKICLASFTLPSTASASPVSEEVQHVTSPTIDDPIPAQPEEIPFIPQDQRVTLPSRDTQNSDQDDIVVVGKTRPKKRKRPRPGNSASQGNGSTAPNVDKTSTTEAVIGEVPEFDYSTVPSILDQPDQGSSDVRKKRKVSSSRQGPKSEFFYQVNIPVSGLANVGDFARFAPW